MDGPHLIRPCRAAKLIRVYRRDIMRMVRHGHLTEYRVAGMDDIYVDSREVVPYLNKPRPTGKGKPRPVIELSEFP